MSGRGFLSDPIKIDFRVLVSLIGECLPKLGLLPHIEKRIQCRSEIQKKTTEAIFTVVRNVHSVTHESWC